ncbi:DUF2231 domain-containing protein [Actinoplanes sp. NPDC026619]|uniref:DUF2231 domain-containing protein n=1 Tax=Actinoplanes sp. NPDC026619 TaxID=3155798 RepID=UPI0033F9C17D
MFDQVNGLPVHALVLHAAVVFVPLLALGAIVYALVAKWRPKIEWAVVALAVVAPITTFVTRESGEKLFDRLAAQGMKAGQNLNDHMHFGSVTFWFTLALGVVTLAQVVLVRRGALPKIVEWVLSAVMIVLAVIAVYYVYRTGDSGAHAVWGQS